MSKIISLKEAKERLAAKQEDKEQNIDELFRSIIDKNVEKLKKHRQERRDANKAVLRSYRIK